MVPAGAVVGRRHVDAEHTRPPGCGLLAEPLPANPRRLEPVPCFEDVGVGVE